MVREGGVEPPHQRYWNLNPARLPIPPPSHEKIEKNKKQNSGAYSHHLKCGANYAATALQNQRISIAYFTLLPAENKYITFPHKKSMLNKFEIARENRCPSL